ncbi:MAG TPA: iron-containing alcohol dehydrogenase [Syntrophales bacterium]|nr:iron-containing alcohol dehydrogenase [Syntrophales bacterium]HOM07036.1 iron-containing alcohol dehydrogenase [Syntrophales bacterium]HON99565.1 iron-containing alcohol dehydrogenase [Syntrophales bacterium]HPC01057.1 iron-containing alcohol dehydrogenase [Syntrophales bacterium]HPQ06804.1 iron-containing alcohol dehydrogenase [Syntrophales bacterium]
METPGYFEFLCPVRIVAGFEALEEIPALLASVSARRPMIVTDRGVVSAGLLDTVRNAMGGRVDVGAVADDVPPDSDLRVVNNLARRWREEGCDSLIAVGGGSVMDTAKGVNIVVSEGGDDLMAYSGAGVLKRPLRPLLAVPTTAGTGSEVTLVAVVKDHDRLRKLAFVSPFILPTAAVLDPRMTLSLPPAVTAATGMDALAHAVEAYYGLQKNPLSDAHAWEAVRLIGEHLVTATRNPSDRRARLGMALAATLAGIAFSNSMVGMVHTLGHAVGAVCGVHHGVCMAVFLPYGLEYNRHRRDAVMGELLLPLAGAEVYGRIPAEQRTDRVISHIRHLNEELHELTGGRHPRCLKEIADREGRPMVTPEAFPEIAAAARGDGSLFYNPEEMDYDDFIDVLEAAWEGGHLGR